MLWVFMNIILNCRLEQPECAVGGGADCVQNITPIIGAVLPFLYFLLTTCSLLPVQINNLPIYSGIYLLLCDKIKVFNENL